MELFSYRKGISKKPDPFQIESISLELKNRLWTCLFYHFFNNMYHGPRSSYGPNQVYSRELCEGIWHSFFKKPVDELDNYNGDNTRATIRNFFFDSPWYQVYDFIEFCYQFARNREGFSHCLNVVFKEEFSGYTIIDGIITQITNEEEISTIETALTIDNKISEHLKTALTYLSDKTKPDYRNSIKESISAVEVICKKIANNPSGDLTDALRDIEKSGKIQFHGALKAAYNNLYGWSSDAGGIRHGMMEVPDLDQEDARYMLISCSAFINYLKIKSDKAGISLV